jgi:hypothetical protein
MMRRRRRSVLLAVLVLAASVLVVRLVSGTGDDSSDVSAEGVSPGGSAAKSSQEPASASPSSVSPSSASPSPSGPPKVVEHGDGTWSYDKPPSDPDQIGHDGTLLTFNIAVEGDIDQDVKEFADFVTATLSDKRSWTAGKQWRFEQTGGKGYADFTVYLASPQTRAELCGADDTYTSCRNGNAVVINLERWLLGVPHWKKSLTSYRQYVVNHEIGHRLGEPHVVCPKKDTPSPVMAQQTIEMRGCEPNSWPYVDGEYITGPAGEYG